MIKLSAAGGRFASPPSLPPHTSKRDTWFLGRVDLRVWLLRSGGCRVEQEVGLKSRFFDNTLQTNLSVYYTRYSNPELDALVRKAMATAERDESLLAEAGFTGMETFYFAMNWRGWVAYA